MMAAVALSAALFAASASSACEPSVCTPVAATTLTPSALSAAATVGKGTCNHHDWITATNDVNACGRNALNAVRRECRRHRREGHLQPLRIDRSHKRLCNERN